MSNFRRATLWLMVGLLVFSANKLAWGQKPVKSLILPGESFLLEGRPAFYFLPSEEKRVKPQPWVMYAPTLSGLPDSHEKWMHEQFLAAGVAVAGIDIGEAFGNPAGQKAMSALHHELTVNRGFAAKPVLLGRSRGGLWVSSWAIANPEKVAGIAGIYPVFDLRSYPGLNRAAPAYGLKPEELAERLAEHNPIAKANVLAKHKIPVCIIHGDSDKVVPLKENSAALVEQYQQAGVGEVTRLIVAAQQGHNYWEGFFRCQELIDFAIARAKGDGQTAASEAAADAKANEASNDKAASSQSDAPLAFPGEAKDWNGFKKYEFVVNGKPVLVVEPQQAATGRPWVWHGEFFGHKPAPDIALLKKGFHIAYVRIPNMLGAPKAVTDWNDCYRELTERYQLAKKVALVGLSRGGLYCYNWAATNPEKVACIYGDAPVCDFKSWPGGKGKGKGSPRDWSLVLERFGFANEAEALAYTKNPVDNLAPLAAAQVPLLHVYGDADDVVPWDENTGVIAERYRKLGGSISLIAKPGVGHHPHGLDDPSPIVDFIVQHSSAAPATTADAKPRDVLVTTAAKLEPSKKVVYKKAAGRELYLHIFEPAGLKPSDWRPCLLLIHGGGWTSGDARRMYTYADHFAKLGIVSVSLQYRLLNAKQGTTVFDSVQDGRSAMRFLRANAKTLGIDPEKIVVSGASAGGHVAAGTALFDGVNGADDPTDAKNTASTPNAMVLLYPVIDTSKSGYGNSKIGERWQDISPAHQVKGKVPPTLIFHGTGDTVTPYAGAVAFRDAMIKAGNRCEIDVNEGGKHGYFIFDEQLYRETLVKFEKFLASVGMLLTSK